MFWVTYNLWVSGHEFYGPNYKLKFFTQDPVLKFKMYELLMTIVLIKVAN